MKLCFRIQVRWLDEMSWISIGYRSAKMLKVADGRSVQRVVAQPPLLGKSLSKVNDRRQRCSACAAPHTWYTYLPPHSSYPQCMWQSMFLMCPELADDSPSLIYCGRLVQADAWLFTDFIQLSQTALCLYSLSKVLFVGATSLVLQQQLSQFLHVLHTQPSSRTFWLMALSVTL